MLELIYHVFEFLCHSYTCMSTRRRRFLHLQYLITLIQSMDHVHVYIPDSLDILVSSIFCISQARAHAGVLRARSLGLVAEPLRQRATRRRQPRHSVQLQLDVRRHRSLPVVLHQSSRLPVCHDGTLLCCMSSMRLLSCGGYRLTVTSLPPPPPLLCLIILSSTFPHPHHHSAPPPLPPPPSPPLASFTFPHRADQLHNGVQYPRNFLHHTASAVSRSRACELWLVHKLCHMQQEVRCRGLIAL